MITKTLAERLRMMYIEMRSKNPGGVEGFDTPLFFEAIAQAEGEKAGELSDEEIERLCQSAFPVPDPAASMPSDSRMASAHWGMSNGLKVARDNDYLRPSQAIGEPDAYMLKREDPLAPSLFTKWEVMRRIELRRNKEEEFIPLYRSPMSSEARDKAIEAGNALKAWIRKNLPHSHTQEGHEAVVVLKAWDQALSALRGE